MSALLALMSNNDFPQLLNWVIQEVRLDAEANDERGELIIQFTNQFSLILRDDGQSCCERRSLSCDDDLTGLVGSRLVSVLVEQITEDGDKDYEACHVMAFLKIQSERYGVTLVSHNEHNGWYGGFTLNAYVMDPGNNIVWKQSLPNQSY